MVMHTRQGQLEVYEVYDDHGEAIGQVILPVDPKVVGRETGTVLLVRGKE
jgi:hypothetical protein